MGEFIGPVEQCRCEKDVVIHGNVAFVSQAVMNQLEKVDVWNPCEKMIPVTGTFEVRPLTLLPDNPWICYKCRREHG